MKKICKIPFIFVLICVFLYSDPTFANTIRSDESSLRPTSIFKPIVKRDEKGNFVLVIDPKDMELEEKLSIGEGEDAIEVSNRRYAQPMEHDNCPDGHLSELTLEIYEDITKLGYGVVGIEAAAVGPMRARFNQLRIGPGYEDDISRLVGHIRKHSPFGDKQIISIQPNHAGSISDDRFSEIIRTYPSREGDPDSTPGRLLVNSDVESIIESYVNAAIIAYEAGVNIVDIKCCHGYLLGQFLRPANQARDDWDWGGSFDNRVRIVEEIISRIRQRIPDKRFKIMVRFSLYEGDNIPGGIGAKGHDSTEMDLKEPLRMGKRFAAAGAQILNVSAGIPKFNAAQWVRPVEIPEKVVKEGDLLSFHHITFARIVKDILREEGRSDVVVIGSGFSVFGEYADSVAEQAIRYGYVDMAGFGRQNLAGEKKCRLCSGCSRLLAGQAPVGCVIFGGPLYRLLDNTRARVNKAVLRNEFEGELARIESQVDEIPQLKDDTEIVRYIRAFIAKQILLGYLEACSGIVDEIEGLIGQAGDTRELAIQKLELIRTVGASFKEREDNDSNFNGLSLVVNNGIGTLVVDLIVRWDSEEIDAEELVRTLNDIKEVLNIFQAWTMYPQFSPSMVEMVDEGRVRLCEEAYILGVRDPETLISNIRALPTVATRCSM